MSLVTFKSIICNGGTDDRPCSAWFEQSDEPAARLRAQAKRHGWERRVDPNRGMLDLCPDCVSEAKP